MPMTARQILARSLPNRKEWAQNVAVSNIKVKKNSTGQPMVVAVTKSLVKNNEKPNKDRFKYVTTVEVYPKENVIVSCSCSDFTFMWEIALSKKNAARIEYSNGELPVDKNPSMRPGACKHTIALLEYLISKGKL